MACPVRVAYRFKQTLFSIHLNASDFSRERVVEDFAVRSTTWGMPARLVALDLDGTVIAHDKTLPAGHRRAVAELMAAGVHVAIVTGRPLITSRWVYHELKLKTPLVCYNGGWVGYPECAPFAVSVLPEADVRDLVAYLADQQGIICCYPDADTWVVDRATEQTVHWPALYQTAIAIDHARIHAWNGTSCKVMFVAEPPRLAQVAARLQADFAGRFHVVVSEEDRFEISNVGITKAWGLSRLAAHLGVERENVWAVGDAANDIEMIGWAGHGGAMGQASDQLKRLARHVLPAVQARGLCVLPGLLARCADG